MNQDIQAVTEATRKAECWSAVTTRREPEVLSRQGTRTDGYDVTARDRKQTEPAEVSPLHEAGPGIGQRGAWFWPTRVCNKSGGQYIQKTRSRLATKSGEGTARGGSTRYGCTSLLGKRDWARCNSRCQLFACYDAGMSGKHCCQRLMSSPAVGMPAQSSIHALRSRSLSVSCPVPVVALVLAPLGSISPPRSARS